MSLSLWVELDQDGNLLRASDDVRQQLMPLYGSDLGFPLLVRSRADLRAALARRAGSLRVALGHGATLAQYDLEVDAGGQGARCVLAEGAELAPGALLERWADLCPDGVLLTDVDGHILRANDSFCAMVGFSAEEVVGRYLSVFRAPRTPERLLAALSRALVGKGHWTGSMAFRRFDGTEFPASVTYTGIRSEGGATTNYVVVISDRTQQEELDRLESLDASTTLIGRVARGFAHDINNLAGELIALVEAAAERGTFDGPSFSQLERIGGAFGNVGRQLLTLATHGAEPPPADLNRVARDLGWLVNRALARTRMVEVAAGAEPVWVDAQADALLRALTPPALRAASEAPATSVLHISTAVEGEEGVVFLRYEADATERERLRALFPEGAVTSHAGNELQTRALVAGVTLSLELGQGGEVVVRAGVPMLVAAELTPEDIRPEPPPRTGRALVVEDNESLQELVVAALKKDFPLTVAAADGFEGLETLELVEGRVDIVVVDLMMPRMQGLEFLRIARERWPDLKVLIVSGAASADQIREARLLGAVGMLPKPFRVSELRAAAQSALGGEQVAR